MGNSYWVYKQQISDFLHLNDYNVPEKAFQDGPNVGDTQHALVSWFQYGLALAVAVTWGLNQWIEVLPLCL